MNRTATRLGVAGTILNLIGLGLAAYLTYEHYAADTFQGCVLGGGCQQVTTSSYSVVLGIPVVLPGLVYFVVSGALHLPAMWRSGARWIARARLAWAVIGMISVFYLIWGELSIGAVCMYCTGVHIVTFVLFVLTLIGSAAISAPGDGPLDDGEATD